MVTDDLIIKVLSGNANSDEITVVSDWRKMSVDNETHFSRLKVYWEQSVHLKRSFEPNTDFAWKRVKEKLIQTPKKSFLYLKIAAGLIITVGLAFLVNYLFSSMAESNLHPIAKKQDIQTHSPATILNSDTSKNSKQEKLFYLRTHDSIREYFLPDSTLVILNKNSQLIYGDFVTADQRIVKLRGEAHFDVTHTNKEFIVVTKHIDVKVLGTSFIVGENKANNTIEIYVEEGSVKAYEIKNPANMVFINSGQKYAFQIKDKKFVKLKSNRKSHWWKKFFSKLRRLFRKK